MDVYTQMWIHTGFTCVAAVVYVAVFIYQRRMIISMRGHTDHLEKSIKTYKELVNVDEFKKHLEVKLETAKDQNLRFVRGIIDIMLEASKKNTQNSKDAVTKQLIGGIHDLTCGISYFINITLPNYDWDKIESLLNSLLINTDEVVKQYIKSEVKKEYLERFQN